MRLITTVAPGAGGELVVEHTDTPVQLGPLRPHIVDQQADVSAERIVLTLSQGVRQPTPTPTGGVAAAQCRARATGPATG
jgi:hypothetical protein